VEAVNGLGHVLAPGRAVTDCEWLQQQLARFTYRPGWTMQIVDDFETAETGGLPLALRTLRLLALPYASHPHYREEWRP
jgi:hypothetical protein